MSHIAWDEKYSVNISVIDEQHRKIVDLLNLLFDAYASGKTQEALAKIVKEITDYAGYHFATEETFMKTYDFPGLAEHQKEHEDFRNKVIAFQKDLAKGKQTLSVEIASFLTSWLDHHILHVDKEYGPFLNEKGIY